MAGMLKRRGFVTKWEWAKDIGEWVEVWERAGE